MFESLELAPADPILGLGEAFTRDANPQKINLSVGIFKDAQGKTPVLACVKEAERRLLAGEASKSYLPITGAPAFGDVVQRMVLGESHPALGAGRAATAQCPGGTGALRVAGDFLHVKFPRSAIWLSDPTWENHANVFQAAGLSVRTYPYFDRARNALAFDEMLGALGQVPEGDAVLLHGCCHNPTGQDPTPEQWHAIAQVLERRRALPLIDFAYQGFGDAPDADASGVRLLADRLPEALICSSFSKNFGLYNERVGALTVLARDAQAAAKAFSHVKRSIRANYSNPPSHGGSVVTTILQDPALRGQWSAELTAMRDRILTMRRLFRESLDARGIALPGGDNGFITRQKGMFSFSGLNPAQVERLRSEHAIYVVGSGRINVAGMSEGTMDRLCAALKAVLP